jgi:glycerol-3-phosphate dehydrogenase
MTEFSWRTRRQAQAQMAEELSEILIIGGGITGAGLALDAATRGLRVALIEKRDFAAGTSSRSTKLIHGGLRYLEHLEFALVREGLRERALLTRLAPHLVEPFPFLVPIYHQPQRNYDHPLKMRAGLWLYDLLAGNYGLGRHRRLTRDAALELAPQLDQQGLKGAFIYYDGRTDDARLVIEVIKSAHEHGAAIANYTRLTGFIYGADGRITGARLRDELTGEEIAARAQLVINATGVWMDEVRELGAPARSLKDKRVRPSKGIHLIIAADRLQLATACLIPSLVSHRFYFVVPWEGRVLIGTTDTDYTGSKDTPRAEIEEVNEILQAINSYFPAARLEPSDVITTFAGLRPLIGDRKKTTTEISREEGIFESHDGLISIAGGKLTTYRRMAERAIDLAAKRLAERFGRDAGHSRTAEIALSGGAMSRDELAQAATHIAQTEGFSLDTAQHLVHAYGSNYSQLLGIAREDERLRAPLIAGLPHLAAEIVHAARSEMALTLSDVLARRTRLSLLAGRAVLECAPMAAELMAQALGWSKEETERQIANFTAEYQGEFAPPS